MNSSMFQRSLFRTRVILRHIKLSVKMSTQAATETEDVIFKTVGCTGVITLNRPKALNALNLSMIRKMYPQMVSWEKDSNIGLVIIKGAGSKAFCAGGDVRAVYEAIKTGDKLPQEFFKEEYVLNHKIGTFKKPYVAIIDGVTMGGGVGLSVHGKYRVATDRTVFAMPETAIGLFPDVGGGYFLPRLRGNLGVYLALTGCRLKGRDVEQAGVATHFVQGDKVEELEEKLINLNSTKEEDVARVLDTYHRESTSGTNHEFVLEPYIKQIDSLFSGGTLEEIFKQLTNDSSEWAASQLKTLQKMSPTSMKVTLRQLIEGEQMNLQDCLQMEYRLSQRCMEDKDFSEGIRAVLVDKDNSPRWDPPTIEGVTEEKLDWYFSPLAEDRELRL